MNSPDNNLVNIEIDGIATTAAKGSMIIEVADRIGVDIPRFCYHPKLSIAASCRMCLVDVEKAPKPMPACATPVMEGMKVFTESKRAVDAQRGIMEFLLINHPLDCPICDQGGECELQDQAVGYGRSVSRFSESKRVVEDKDIGPLVQTEMTRCIHCTRCVRFLEEIAGTDELGGIGRGDRLEIGTMVARSIDSELSGNVIDVCPVGALTNKPFRFSARAWELMARASVSSHDGVTSNLYYHTRRNEILRCVPRDNEALNECWISDRDRYSHYGLRSDERLHEPMVKDSNGSWQIVDWDVALDAAAEILTDAGEDLGMLLSPSAFNEEYLLARRLLKGLGGKNIDSRLRETTFTDDASRQIQFECQLSEMAKADAVLLIGSNIHEDAPILGHKVRQAWLKNQAAIYAVMPRNYNYHFDCAETSVIEPGKMLGQLLSIAKALGESLDTRSLQANVANAVENAAADEFATHAANALKAADNALLLVGKMALSHPQADWIRALAQAISQAVAGRCNLIADGGNSTGARYYGAQPADGGLDVAQMLENPAKGWLLWNVNPALDFDHPALVQTALAAGKVLAVSSFNSDAILANADVILPLAATAESEGSLMSFDGQLQQVSAASKAPGMSKPGWKILHRLGTQLGLEGFEFSRLGSLEMPEECAAVRTDFEFAELEVSNGLNRLGEVGIYSVNAECRQSAPLQDTHLASRAVISMNPEDISTRDLSPGATVTATQGDQQIHLVLKSDPSIAAGCVLLPAAMAETAHLGSAWAAIEVEAK